jgi:sarcosine oxidase subunit gamma
MRSRALETCGIVRVQTWQSQVDVTSKAAQWLGVAWPERACTLTNGRADVLCIGPTDWLVLAPDPDVAWLLQALEVAFDVDSFRATDLTQALARVEIEGAEVRALLAKGCSLDLHPSRYPPGHYARTRFGGMPVVVRCQRETVFECIVASSYRDYLVSWLADAALEFS